MDNSPITKTDEDGAGWGDKIMGALIGTATNIVPGSTRLRELYHPKDADDYNSSLKTTDDAALAAGSMFMKGGSGTAGAGLVVAGVGVAVTVGSGGTLAVGGVPTAVVGGAMVEAGALTAAAGAVLTSSAAANQSKGYNYGKPKQQQSTSEQNIKKAQTIQESKNKGNAGEIASNTNGPKKAIKVNNRVRYPDKVTTKTVEESKNVNKQGWTQQLKDYLQYAQDQLKQLVLHTNEETKLSKPLEKQIESGNVVHKTYKTQ
ncbi:MAG: hypothetical protein H7329_14430 [Opitutaceae bacterium]|nr:hypothetical protein [Cytophagales bacterium]